MSDPTLTVSIDRTGLSLSPLVFNGARTGSYGIVHYVPPAMVARVGYMPDSPNVDGSEAISAAWGQGILGVDWIPLGAANETAVQSAYAAVIAAIGQFSYTVTTQVNGAPAQVWTADRGSMQLGGSDGRTYVDLVTRTPIYALSIPVYPVPA